MKSWALSQENDGVYVILLSTNSGGKVVRSKIRPGGSGKKSFGSVTSFDPVSTDDIKEVGAKKKTELKIPIGVVFSCEALKCLDLADFNSSATEFSEKFHDFCSDAEQFCERFKEVSSELSENTDAEGESRREKRKSTSSIEAEPLPVKKSMPAIPVQVPETKIDPVAQWKKEQSEKEIGVKFIPTKLIRIDEQVFRKTDKNIMDNLEREWLAGNYCSYHQPLAVEVVNLTDKKEFNMKKLGTYHLRALGGQNNTATCQRIIAKAQAETDKNGDPENIGITQDLLTKLANRMAVVYCKLSDEARLYISANHQQISKASIDPTFQDLVRMGHAIKLAFDSKNRKPIEWKEHFRNVIKDSRMALNTTKENLVFYLAEQPKDVFDLFEHVVSRHEKDCLKNNKSLQQLQKKLPHKPEMSYSSISYLHKLPRPVLVSFLRSVKNGNCTLSEMNESARKYKIFEKLREYFQQETDCEWQEIVEKLGDEISETALEKEVPDWGSVKLKARGMPEFPDTAKDMAVKLRYKMRGPESTVKKHQYMNATAAVLPSLEIGKSLDTLVDLVVVNVVLEQAEADVLDSISGICTDIRDYNLQKGYQPLGVVVLSNPRFLVAVEQRLREVAGFRGSTWSFVECKEMKPANLNVLSSMKESVCGVIYAAFGGHTLHRFEGSSNFSTLETEKEFWEETLKKFTRKAQTVAALNAPGLLASLCLFEGRNILSFHSPWKLEEAVQTFKGSAPRGTLFSDDRKKSSEPEKSGIEEEEEKTPEEIHVEEPEMYWETGGTENGEDLESDHGEDLDLTEGKMEEMTQMETENPGKENVGPNTVGQMNVNID